jgi:hypothetical protein
MRHSHDGETRRRISMNYVLLIYQGTTPLPGTEAWDALPADEQKAVYADYSAISNTPGISPGLPLGLPEKARTVRVEDGRAVVMEGPYMGPMGAVGGYVTFEADEIDDAIELAARIPAARLGGAIEVRPVETYW